MTSKYIKKDPALHKKTGPKPGSIGENIRKRLSKFNGYPVPQEQLPKSANDFYERAQLILMQQIGKLTAKSLTSNLDINEIRILDSMIKSQLVLDSKQQDLPQESTPELLEQALLLLKEKADKQLKDTNEPDTEAPTPTKED